MKSKRSLEGHIELDQRASGDGVFEWATYTCKHCNLVCKLDPLRQRPAPYCRKCDRYICEKPQCSAECRPMIRLAEEQANAILSNRGFWI